MTGTVAGEAMETALAATGGRVCVVVRRGHAVLAFRHPLAGVQLVKGRREPGESVLTTARRELLEEAGLRAARVVPRGYLPCLGWHLVEAWGRGLPSRWSHICADDGGHRFRFFWHPLGGSDAAFDPMFRKVLRAVEGWR